MKLPFVFSLDMKETPSVAVTARSKEVAAMVNFPAQSVSDDEFKEIAEAYVAWRCELGTNFGEVRRPRLRKGMWPPVLCSRHRLTAESAVGLCKRTVRFLVGVAFEMGLAHDEKYAFSLGFFALEHYTRAVIEVTTKRAKVLCVACCSVADLVPGRPRGRTRP